MNIGYRARCDGCDDTKDCASKLQVYEWAEDHGKDCEELGDDGGIVMEVVVR